MFVPKTFRRAGRVGVALAASCSFVAIPAVAQAAPVNLATAGPFVVLGGSAVSNTGPSLLNGDLGVSPGTAVTGFGLPAVVNGVTHVDDAEARSAQLDLTEAYNTAAGEPVPPANDLTGTDLGQRTLTAGVYRYSTSAQLTGTLTLDGEGDPAARFIFQIGSTLTTAPGSVVALNGVSPCNVFWQVGTSATLDTTTRFVGNVMAQASISLENAASVDGRLLAMNGGVTLINNTLDSSMCADDGTGPVPPDDTPTPPIDVPPITIPVIPPIVLPPVSPFPPTGTPNNPPSNPPTTASVRPAGQTPGVNGGPPVSLRRTPRGSCTEGFRARIEGRRIQRVVFRLDGKRIARRTNSPYSVVVHAMPGRHNVSARVTFTDGRRARTFSLRYRACAAAARNPRPGPAPFTG